MSAKRDVTKETSLHEDENSLHSNNDDEEWVGPKVSEATEHLPKKRKVLHHEKLFLDK